LIYCRGVTIYAPDFINIQNAINALENGELIGLPTETVYGLGADCNNEYAVANIFALKGRPSFNPLISHVADIEMAQNYGVFSQTAIKIATHFWPNALTIVAPRKIGAKVCDLTCAGLETIALRCPKHEIAQEIIKGFGKPICAPSANISGQISPTNAHHVADDFGDKLPIIIDGGDCQIGLESTVIAVFDDEVTLLRLGSISAQEIEGITKKSVQIANLHDESAPKSPGMLLRHYSPHAPLYLDCQKANEGEIFIGFGDYNGDLNLSNIGSLTQAAANLYGHLRKADSKNPSAIKVAPIPNIGIGLAINDRLSRAAEK
jgi:L-threonylcarbamoyladenylate synthase